MFILIYIIHNNNLGIGSCIYPKRKIIIFHFIDNPKIYNIDDNHKQIIKNNTIMNLKISIQTIYLSTYNIRKEIEIWKILKIIVDLRSILLCYSNIFL